MSMGQAFCVRHHSIYQGGEYNLFRLFLVVADCFGIATGWVKLIDTAKVFPSPRLNGNLLSDPSLCQNFCAVLSFTEWE